MTKLDLNISVLSLAGTAIENSNLGQLLADALAMSADGKMPPVKLFGWAVQLFNKQELVLDESDAALLESFVTNHPGMVVLVKAQILARLKSKE